MIHNIRFRLFVYPHENEYELHDGLINVLGDVEVEREIAEGINEEPIVILSGRITKKKILKDLITNLKSDLNFDRDDFLDKIDKKMDENSNLFIRLSKESAKNKELEILDGGDSIHLKIKIAAYPSKKEIAIPIVKELFA
ncbi:MAG: exosome protein [Methanobrevibacter sp.]|jgi:RNA binding exosome subunit|nr:exosome protein [Candidatus Methanovirga aequatorialis]